jgi:hypothetical protein
MSNVYLDAMTKVAGTIGQTGEMALRRVVQEVADKATGNFGATVGARRLSLEHHIPDQHLIDYVGKHGTDAHLREAQGILNSRMKEHQPSAAMKDTLSRHDRGWRRTADGGQAREDLPGTMSRSERKANPLPTLTDKPAAPKESPADFAARVRKEMFAPQAAKAAPEAAPKSTDIYQDINSRTPSAAKAAPEAAPAAKAAPEAAPAAPAAPAAGNRYQEHMNALKGQFQQVKDKIPQAVQEALSHAKGTGKVVKGVGVQAADAVKANGGNAAAAGVGAAVGAGVMHLGGKLIQRAGKTAAPAVSTTAKTGLASIHPAALIGGSVVGGVALDRAINH